MPVYPVARAECRLLMQRIENDWYPVFAKAADENNLDSIAARKQLREELLAVAPIFTQYEYFMSNEFSLVDCYLAPLLWRIQLLGIEFSGAGSKAIKNYMNKVFSRDSFAKSLGNSSALNIMDDK